MGTLFPDDDEYPDHRSLPARLAHVSGQVAFLLVAGFFAMWDLRPGAQSKPDPPQREFIPPPVSLPAAGVGSTSAVPFGSGNNSQDTAIAVIRQAAHARRDMHARVLASSSGMVGSPLYQST
jgi:hypothetical protein